MKFFKAIIVIMMIATIGFVVYRNVNSKDMDYSQTIRCELRDIEETLTISGTVQPQKEIEVKSTISGVLESLSVQIGDEVKIGQGLARVQYVKDPMELKNLLKTIEVAKTRYENALHKFKSSTALYEKRLLSPLEYQNEKDELAILRAEYESVKSELNMLKGQYHNNGVSNTISATGNGTILELPVKEGGSVMARGTLNEGTTIARIADLKSLLFKGEVTEADMAKLYVGMPVRYTLTTIPDVTLHGKVMLISPKGTVREGIARFQITADIEIPEHCRKYIKAGCTANASVVLNSKHKVLALEEKYFQFSYDTVFVEVRNNKGEYEKRILKTGISDGIYTEITKGLTIKDVIKKKSKDEEQDEK
ncbi:MAG: efflux RND transporter periplasmic adaptor subunit [Prevotella sp.]|nr:efflux RND transporter periplasmic adaptor subunit [Prevotella sp.]